MCGIAGVVSAKPIPEEVIDQLTSSLRHRGPDGSGVYRFSAAGYHLALIHTRLSIIDLAGGAQPLHDPRTGYHLVANGELYNYRALKKELIGLGLSFSTQSDSEVLLKAWVAWGERSLTRLHGMYSYALFNDRSRTLTLVRDRFGIKPLYTLSVAGGSTYFSSEMSLLTPIAAQSGGGMSAPVLAEYLLNQVSLGDATLCEGVMRVPPAHYVCVDGSFARAQKRYWSLERVVIPKKSASSAASAVAQTGMLFDQSIQEHVVADVPLAAYLSGGIDSGLIVATVAQVAPLTTLSVGYRGDEGDDEQSEVSAAGRLARQFGCDHHELSLSQDDLYARLAFVLSSSDELMRDFAALPLSFLAEKSQALGLKIALCGEGGDEGFAGYRRLMHPWLHRMLGNMLVAGSDGYRLKPQLPVSVVAPLLSQQTVADSWAGVQATTAALKSQARHNGFTSFMQVAQYVELSAYLPNQLLVKTDRALMRFGVEGRVPFLDHRLVAFGVSLPDKHKVLRGLTHTQGKQVLRSLFAKRANAAGSRRPKKGFTVPLVAVVKRLEERGLVAKLQAQACLQQHLRMEHLGPVLERASTSQRARLLMSLLHVALWHQHHLAGQALPPLSIDPLEALAG